ncbi:MAG: agmatine deiminase family protein [Cellvibrionaceae bacterium]
MAKKVVARKIIADYECPAAIMVPHYHCDLTPLLEDIASNASHSIGVILLTSDKSFTESFVATQKFLDRFSIVTAPLDSPWIRDRSPIAIRQGKIIRWCIPRWDYVDRPNDTILFERICASAHPITPIDYMPQGNLVVAKNGLVFTTEDILKKNSLTKKKLLEHNSLLGIKQWIIFKGFKQEPTGHADIHVRVLKPKLFAVAWNLSSKQDRQRTETLITMISTIEPKAEVIKIPIRSKGKHYASLVNWIQIGRQLLIPRFNLTRAEDITQTRNLLAAHGFKSNFIYSPTLDVQGSLHCLTGSIFI